MPAADAAPDPRHHMYCLSASADGVTCVMYAAGQQSAMQMHVAGQAPVPKTGLAAAFEPKAALPKPPAFPVPPNPPGACPNVQNQACIIAV